MKLDHLVLLANDMERSARFYDAVLTVLGFRKSHDWVWINGDGLAVDLRSAEGDRRYERYGPGLNHFAFTSETRAEFDAVLAGLERAGIALPPTQAFGDALAVFIPDPDGLRVEIGWDPEV